MNARIEVGDSAISGYMGDTPDAITQCVGVHVTEMLRDEVAHGVALAGIKITIELGV